ncbi:MAG: peptide-methionine (R)-S-oxide reductase, partial [Hyphomicrobiaceae bacterium]
MNKSPPDAADKVAKTDAQWRSELTPEQYYITRQHGTERAGSSPLNREKRQGEFACVCCGEPLFSS